MLEFTFESILSFIDYTYLLYFYLVLISSKWNLKKAIPWILGIVMIQTIKEYMVLESISSISLLIDTTLVVLFLYLYDGNYTLKNFMYAVMVNCLFQFAIVLFVSSTITFGFDISLVLTFGTYRFVFSVILKICTILFFKSLMNPLKIIQSLKDNKIERIIVISLIMISLSFTMIQENSLENKNILIFTILLTFILIIILYLFCQYCSLIDEKADDKLIQSTMEITLEHVNKLEKEYMEIRKIRHDMRGQLTSLNYLLKQKRFEEASEILDKLYGELDANSYKQSGNVYIDAILRQKMNEYAHIHFDLDIQISNDFDMDGKNIVSILSNVIDNACEELDKIREITFKLKIKADAFEFYLEEQNQCRDNINFKSEKHSQNHGLGLKILQSIVNKYNGCLKYESKNNIFKLTLYLSVLMKK